MNTSAKVSKPTARQRARGAVNDYFMERRREEDSIADAYTKMIQALDRRAEVDRTVRESVVALRSLNVRSADVAKVSGLTVKEVNDHLKAADLESKDPAENAAAEATDLSPAGESSPSSSATS